MLPLPPTFQMVLQTAFGERHHTRCAPIDALLRAQTWATEALRQAQEERDSLEPSFPGGVVSPYVDAYKRWADAKTRADAWHAMLSSVFDALATELARVRHLDHIVSAMSHALRVLDGDATNATKADACQDILGLLTDHAGIDALARVGHPVVQCRRDLIALLRSFGRRVT